MVRIVQQEELAEKDPGEGSRRRIQEKDPGGGSRRRTQEKELGGGIGGIEGTCQAWPGGLHKPTRTPHPPGSGRWQNGKMSTMIWVWIGLDWIGWMDGWMDGAPFEEADKQRPTGTQTPPSSCTYINFEHVL